MRIKSSIQDDITTYREEPCPDPIRVLQHGKHPSTNARESLSIRVRARLVQDKSSVALCLAEAVGDDHLTRLVDEAGSSGRMHAAAEGMAGVAIDGDEIDVLGQFGPCIRNGGDTEHSEINRQSMCCRRDKRMMHLKRHVNHIHDRSSQRRVVCTARRTVEFDNDISGSVCTDESE